MEHPLLNRFQTATATAANTHGTHISCISVQIVRNRLHEGGLGARRPYVGCVLGRRHRVNRVNLARKHQRWLRQQWNSVLFSDESRVTIHRRDGTVRVGYTVGEMNVMPRSFWGVGSVFVRAGIAHGFRTNLVVIEGNLNAPRHRDEILARQVIPLFPNNANITLFQHDNATSHTARDTVNLLRANNIAFIYD